MPNETSAGENLKEKEMNKLESAWYGASDEVLFAILTACLKASDSPELDESEKECILKIASRSAIVLGDREAVRRVSED